MAVALFPETAVTLVTLVSEGCSVGIAGSHRTSMTTGGSMMTIQAINPATSEVLKTYAEMAPETVKGIVSKTHEDFLGWRRTTFSDRAGLMRKAGEILRANAGEYAHLMAQEMGKPVRDGVAEAQKCALACDFYAENARRFLAREPVATEGRSSFGAFPPLGRGVAVMPWNFPFWQVFRFAAPGLMAGNAAVLKHASNVPGCALAIERVFAEAGFPEDLFRTVLIPGRAVKALIEDEAIAAVTLTGSVEAG